MKTQPGSLNDGIETVHLNSISPVTTENLPETCLILSRTMCQQLDCIVVGEVRSVGTVCRDKGLVEAVVDCGSRCHRTVSRADNLNTGMKVAFAALGAKINGGRFIDLQEIDGVETSGVICTPYDLDLGSCRDQVLELPPELTVGTPLTEITTRGKAVDET